MDGCCRSAIVARLVTILAAWLTLSTMVGAATSPTTRATTPTVRAEKTSPTLLRDADLSMFFPATQHDGNAASAYSQAFAIYSADRDRTLLRDQWDALLERRSMRAALEQITSGALCRSCDFLPFLPDDLSRRTKFPYLVETQSLAKLLSTRFERELSSGQPAEAGQREAALATARTLMAFGRHLRASAMVLGQEVQGVAIERLAASCFRKALVRDADAVTSAKLTVVEQLLEWTQSSIADAVSSHSAAGAPALSADLAWLRSGHPVLRCEAILNMAQAALPSSVLVKPTPALDFHALFQTLDQATTPSIVHIQREDFETKIKWPRQGVRPGLRAEDVRRLREILAPVAESDPDGRVRVLAQRLLDALVEPEPTQTDRPSGRPTRPLPPPPRPPRVPPPR